MQASIGLGAISCSLCYFLHSHLCASQKCKLNFGVLLTQSNSSVVRAADMILAGPRIESWLGHHFSMVLLSLSDSWHYPYSVENVIEMAAPSEMCWANEELESPVGKKGECSDVWWICPFGKCLITSKKLVWII